MALTNIATKTIPVSALVMKFFKALCFYGWINQASVVAAVGCLSLLSLALACFSAAFSLAFSCSCKISCEREIH